MLAEGSRRNSQLFSDDSLDGDVARPRDIDGIATIPVSSSLSPSSSPGFSLESNHIQHRVSRMDTLAGVAIKYGVESRSLMNGFSLEKGDITEEEAVFEAWENSDIERCIRRRQKTDTPELFLEDSNGGFTGRTGKGIAPRPKSGYRIDTDVGRLSPLPIGDYVKNEGLASVRKSSSTSCLQSQDLDNISSMWLMSKWSLKSDVLARPIFDGLPKSMTVRRNKAARD
ncbi:hypothetical protein BHE74_00053992 [Ensete ventricosum]|nr:hypothetical protein GW17_00047285 [Ensete ventricosum]RWW40585.1 hypothetical protein BHE74_00053992 [Ensete ventricosum]RZR87218.1 hypothetical protein BHM03_00014580 [Ensete ventricosum]